MRRKEVLNLFLSTAISACLFSCSSKDDVANDGNNSSLESFMTSNNEQSVLLNIDYSLDNCRVDFDIYSVNPYDISSQGVITKRKDVSPIVSAMTDENGNFNLSRSLPGNVKELYAVSSGVGTPLLMHADIVDGKAKFTKINRSDLVEAKVVDSRSISTDFKLGSWNRLGKPDYIDASVKCTLTGSEFNSISSALPEWQEVDNALCKSNGIHISKSGKVWISVIGNKSLFNNTLSYYCYKDGDKASDITEIIAFPSTSTYSLLDGLRNNEYVELKYYDKSKGTFSEIFPQGVNIGFSLHVSSFNLLSGAVTNGRNQFYTNSSWNVENNNKKHAAIFSTKKGNIIMGFEDMNNDKFGDNDCNDVVFNIKSDDSKVLSLDIPEIDINNDVEKTEVVKSIQALKDIVPEVASDAVLKDLYVKTTSTIKIVNGSVVAVTDNMSISNIRNTYSLLVSDFFSSNFISYKDSFTRAGKRLVHTTVKRITEESQVRSTSDEISYKPASDIIVEKMNFYRNQIKNNRIVDLTIGYEFTPVDYSEFMTIIPVGPFTPFIENE